MRYTRIALLLLLSGIHCMEAMAQPPAGYYKAARGKSGKALKSTLATIVSGGTRLTYGAGQRATWKGFEQTDCREDGSVWDMYSSQKYTFRGEGASVKGLDIEHILPKSWWGGVNNPAYKDLHHLVPANSSANRSKSNLPPGIVADPAGFNNGVFKTGTNVFGSDYSERCFEPSDEYKGDFARAYFYVLTAYEEYTWNCTSFLDTLSTYPLLRPWAAKLLIGWARRDPVSEKEIRRNEAVYRIQQNRNPFIDCPELCEFLWGTYAGEPFAEGKGATKSSPSGRKDAPKKNAAKEPKRARLLVENKFNQPTDTIGWNPSGWVAFKDKNQTAGTVKLGSASRHGEITTPLLDLRRGAVVHIRARQFGNATGAVVHIGVGQDAHGAITLCPSFEDYEVTISPYRGLSRISIMALAGRQVEVAEVKVVCPFDATDGP